MYSSNSPLLCFAWLCFCYGEDVYDTRVIKTKALLLSITLYPLLYDIK